MRFRTMYFKNPLAQILNTSLLLSKWLILEKKTSRMVEERGLPVFSKDLKSKIPVIA